MKIVVFDDNKKELDELTQTVHSWKSHHNYSDVIIHSYLDTHSLLFSIPDIDSYDVFFLDIMTDDDPSSGFRLAERIHQQNRKAFIIFTTNSKEYFESAFEISAFRYMLKPLNKQKIASVLDEVYSRSRLVKNHAFIFQSNRQRMIIDSDQILYLESLTTDHRAKLFLTDGSVREISLSGTKFSSLVDEKLSTDFYQCHRSFIVNLNYLTKYSSHMVILHNDIEIPVSSKYRTELTNRMIDHFKKAY